jgi:hypothetical protein
MLSNTEQRAMQYNRMVTLILQATRDAGESPISFFPLPADAINPPADSRKRKREC